MTGATAAFVYAAAIVAASAVTVTRPAQAALLPQLAPRSEQLTAINVLSGWVESVSFLVGPALAGVLIAFDGPGAAVGCFALITTVSALLVTGLGSDERRARRRARAIGAVADGCCPAWMEERAGGARGTIATSARW